MSSHSTKRHPLGFFQLDPVPDSETLEEFYQSRYYDLLRQGGRAPELRKLLDTQRERPAELAWLEATLYQDISDAMGAFVPGGASVLDVGCGAGDLIRFLNDRGFKTAGIDPSADAVAEAATRGLGAHTATLEQWAEALGNHGLYQAVTLINVLEHVPDPVAMLKAIRSLLAPTGVICFQVPNDFTALQEVAESCQIERRHWWVAVPDHINYFSEESARALCVEVGF